MSNATFSTALLSASTIDNANYESSLLHKLLIDSKLYTSSTEFKELLDFTIRLRNLAPFNAMLLQIQKPGLTYAASEHDWKFRFNRTVKDKVRPLLIMWPFSPVALVYDILDTEGADLPKGAFAFYAAGKIDEERVNSFFDTLKNKRICINSYDQGDNDAGYIKRLSISTDKKKYSNYELGMNRNHTTAMRFVTLAHELGHLFLGHLGDDNMLQIQGRRPTHPIREIEAESVAYIVCNRNGIETQPHSYLSNYIANNDTFKNLDIHAITRAAGRIERLFSLSKNMQWVKTDNDLFSEKK